MNRLEQELHNTQTTIITLKQLIQKTTNKNKQKEYEKQLKYFYNKEINILQKIK